MVDLEDSLIIFRFMKMNLCSEDSPQNIVKFLERRGYCNVPSNLVHNWWFGQATNFSTRILDHWTEDEFTKLPLLAPEEALHLFRQISSNLKSVNVVANHCTEKRVFLFGNCYMRIKRFDFSRLFKIMHEKCVNLEEASIDMQEYCSKCGNILFSFLSASQLERREDEMDRSLFYVQKILENNPKLRVLTLMSNKRLNETFPQEDPLPALKELTVKGCSFNFTPPELPKVLNEILRYKKTLQCLRMDLKVSELSKLAALKMCSSLKELRIVIVSDTIVQIEGDMFFTDVIKGCPNLEYVYFENITLTDETLNQLYSLPNYKQVFLTTAEKPYFKF